MLGLFILENKTKKIENKVRKKTSLLRSTKQTSLVWNKYYLTHLKIELSF